MTPEDLVELRAIEALKYRYVRLIDTKAWDELETLFVPDATATYSDGKYSFEGRDAIMAFLRESMASTNMLTSHKVHQPEIELDGDRATATWALEDVVLHLDYNLRISGAAFYSDRYVKVDGEWKIEHTGYERVYEEMQPRAEDIKLTARKWKPDA
jgi:uncharacterized protein (TIGR02246 family)